MGASSAAMHTLSWEVKQTRDCLGSVVEDRLWHPEDVGSVSERPEDGFSPGSSGHIW